MLKKQLKRSARYNEDGSLPELIGKDLQRNLDNVDTKLEDACDCDSAYEMLNELLDEECSPELQSRIEMALKNKPTQEELHELLMDARDELEGKITGSMYNRIDDVIDELSGEDLNEAEEDAEEPAEDLEDDAEAPEDGEENPEDEVPDHLETDLEEPEETFKDINEKVVVYLYRGFAEMGDQVRLFVEDTENEERDPELVETLQDFMEGFPEVMDVVKELAKKYVTSVDLYDTEKEEEITDEDPENDEVGDAEAPEEDAEDMDDEVEDKETVESYIKEHNFDHNLFESEYEIYAPYSSEEQALQFEEDLRKFKSAEVFRHADIGEIHAYIKVR